MQKITSMLFLKQQVLRVLDIQNIKMFKEETGQPYFDLKHEYHPEYFETMGKILSSTRCTRRNTTRIASYALIASEYYTVYIPKSVDSIVDINDLVNLDEKSCKIITVSGSYAEQYAKEHGMNYEIVDGWEVPEEE